MGLVLLCSTVHLGSAWAETLVFDASNSAKRQQIAGFGTSVAGWGEGYYDIDTLAKTYYDDLGASMLRIEMGHYAAAKPIVGGRRTQYDFETPVAFKTALDAEDTTWAEVLDYNVSLLDFDAYRVRTHRQMAEQGYQRNIDGFKVIGTVWTPPHWMKGSYTQNGFEKNPYFIGFDQADSADGQLQQQYIDDFAHYVAAWVKGFEDASGGPLHAISLQNEPQFTPGYNSAFYSKELYAQTIIAIREAFDDYGISGNTLIMGPEHIGIGADGDDGGAWAQHRFMEQLWYEEGLMEPLPFTTPEQGKFRFKANLTQQQLDQANRLLDVYAIHGYDGRKNPTATAADPAERWRQYIAGRPEGFVTLPNGQQVYLDSFAGVGNDPLKRGSWMTEFDGALHKWTADASDPHTFDALDQAVATHEALVHGNVEAYLNWQLTYDTRRGTAQETFDAQGEVLALSTPDGNIETTGPKYAAAKHFYRYIRPGMTRYELAQDGDAAGDSGIEGVLISAFYNDDTNDLTIVIINTSQDAPTLTLDLSAIANSVNDLYSLRSVEGDYLRYVGQQDFTNGELTLTLERESILTLTTVPEPSTIGLIGGAGTMLLRRRAH